MQQIANARPFPGMNRWKNCSTRPRECRATLLIPDYLDRPTRELCRQYGGLRGLLGVLLKKYAATGRRICCQRETRIATLYQSQNLNLRRRHFRARGEQWAAARAISRSCGVSTCYFLIVLIELELAGEPADPDMGGAPPVAFRVEHREWVNIGRRQLFRIGRFHHKPGRRAKPAKHRQRVR